MDDKENNKISFSVFREMFRNSTRLTKVIWEEKKGIIVASLFVFSIISTAPFLQSGLNGLLINELVKTAGSGNVGINLIVIIIAVISISFILSAMFKVQEYVSRILYFLLEEKFTLLVLKKKGEIDIASHEEPKQNDLLNKIKEHGVWRTQNFAHRQYYLMQNIIEVIIASTVLIFFKWWVFLILLLGTLPELIIEIKYGEHIWNIHTARAEIRRKYWELESHFYSTHSITELKLFQNTFYFISKIKDLLITFLNEQKNTEKKKILNQLWSVSLSQTAAAFAMLFFIFQIVQGNILIGTFVFVFASIANLRTSLSGLFDNLGRQYQDNLFVSDMFKFLDIPAVIEKPEKGIVLNSKKTPEIIFENINFAYPETEKLVLKNFSLKIEAGEKLAIIGVNGVGKTTLIKLLCRFYDPIKGRILIDGYDLKEIDLESWYRALGALFQDYSHYHFVVRDAIAIGKTSVEQKIKKVKDSAKASEADVFIEEWENSYDQMLGKEFSEGVEPSIGQWQKLALARTFYRDSRILVLDEPTSSIDAEAEAKIFERLEKLPKDRTVILISHRFSTVRYADKIAVIADGELKELGNHENLLQKNGIYAKLFNLQAKRYR